MGALAPPTPQESIDSQYMEYPELRSHPMPDTAPRSKLVFHWQYTSGVTCGKERTGPLSDRRSYTAVCGTLGAWPWAFGHRPLAPAMWPRLQALDPSSGFGAVGAGPGC
ncbi:collagen alpha-2(XI) chain [Platysternon megacephalum]|uniref:Collagen alpha-1(XI) chain-like n=1 Tax=Platysternon megacephalum TaxID=55544 RepID=A0A4D9DK26_9SAUR|nr:collagen alpha-1(XI) chain-like [Platysternon megacephalum]TFJ97845.1 collagen alpha-2(XI) chain [Platysternon megacephalum]